VRRTCARSDAATLTQGKAAVGIECTHGSDRAWLASYASVPQKEGRPRTGPAWQAPPGRTLWLPPGPAAARGAAGDAAAAPAAAPGPLSPWAPASALVASSSAPARRRALAPGARPRLHA